MGKSLVIKGIDASPANLGSVTLATGEIDITNNIQLITSQSGYSTQYLKDSGSFNDAIHVVAETSLPKMKMGYINVSNYIGKTLRCTVYTAPLPSASSNPPAYWMCFASAISSTNVGKTTVQNGVTPVERVAGTGGSTIVTMNLTIPQNSVYFVFRYQTDYAASYSFKIIEY